MLCSRPASTVATISVYPTATMFTTGWPIIGLAWHASTCRMSCPLEASRTRRMHRYRVDSGFKGTLAWSRENYDARGSRTEDRGRQGKDFAVRAAEVLGALSWSHCSGRPEERKDWRIKGF